jgi:hypothetical protein
MEVVTAYVLLGKVSLVIATTGVPEDTVRKWKMQPWWKEAEDEIRRSSKLALSGKLQDVVARTFTALEDRVANGDYLYDAKLHKFVRKPINAIVANKIITDLIDKSMMLEEKGSKEAVTEEGIQQRLDKIREEFRAMITARRDEHKGRKPNEENVIDVTPIVRELPSPSGELQSNADAGGHDDGDRPVSESGDGNYQGQSASFGDSTHGDGTGLEAEWEQSDLRHEHRDDGDKAVLVQDS